MITNVRLLKAIEILSGSGPPPKEMRLFRNGWNDTTKGVFLFDDLAIESVTAAMADWGNRYSFDYDHQALADHALPEEKRAAGWFDMEVRDGELWAVNIDWTPAMLKFIESREYNYLSPAFSVDEYGRIKQIINCAVTNLPATKHAMPLVSCKSLPFHAFPVHDVAWDAKAATDRIAKWASKDGSGNAAEMDWHKYSLAFAWRDDRFKSNTFAAYKLPHHDVAGNTLITSKAGVEASAAAVMGRGGMDIPTTDKPGVRAHLAAHFKQMGLNPPWQGKLSMTLEELLAALKSDPAKMSELLTVLGLSKAKTPVQPKAKQKDKADADDADSDDDEDADSDDDDDEEKMKKCARREAKAKLLKRLGLGANVEAVKGRVLALAQQGETITKLTKQIQDMVATGEKDAAEKTIEAAIADGKVAPGNAKLIEQLRTLSSKALASFVETMPVIVTTSERKPKEDESAGLKTLSAVESKVVTSILGGLTAKDGTPIDVTAQYLSTKKDNMTRATTMELSSQH